jgi:hypothetical protein
MHERWGVWVLEAPSQFRDMEPRSQWCRRERRGERARWLGSWREQKVF